MYYWSMSDWPCNTLLSETASKPSLLSSHCSSEGLEANAYYHWLIWLMFFSASPHLQDRINKACIAKIDEAWHASVCLEERKLKGVECITWQEERGTHLSPWGSRARTVRKPLLQWRLRPLGRESTKKCCPATLQTCIIFALLLYTVSDAIGVLTTPINKMASVAAVLSRRRGLVD